MNLPLWVYDPWFISLITALFTLALGPILKILSNKIRSLRGSFSGIYLAMTSHPGSDDVVIELVKCRHIGNKIEGKIYGISFAEFNNEKLTELTSNDAIYQFKGFVDERVLVLSYNTKKRSAKASGSLTLEGDSPGKVFTGFWSGFDGGRIASSPCIWIKGNKKIASLKNRTPILEEAERFLAIEKSPWINKKSSEVFYVAGQGGVGKTITLNAIKKSKLQRRDAVLFSDYDGDFINKPFRPDLFDKLTTSTEQSDDESLRDIGDAS